MKNYYNEVEAAIVRNEAEIKHLKEELRGLRSVEKDTPRESYQRQEAQILRHLETEQSRLEGNKQLIKNYELAQLSLRKLDELRTLRNKERDYQTRMEIDEEISAREIELENSMAALTDELRQEVRENYLNVNQNEALTITGEPVDSLTAGDISTEISVEDIDNAKTLTLSKKGSNHSQLGPAGDESNESPTEDERVTDETTKEEVTNTELGPAGDESNDGAPEDETVTDETAKEEVTNNPSGPTGDESNDGTTEDERVTDETAKEEATNNPSGPAGDQSNDGTTEDETVTDETAKEEATNNPSGPTGDESNDGAPEDETITDETAKEEATNNPSGPAGDQSNDGTTEDETVTDETAKEEVTNNPSGPASDESNDGATEDEAVTDESLEEKRRKMDKLYKDAEVEYQNAIKQMQDIFQEERDKSEEHGPYATSAELDDFQSDYMTKKQRQNDLIEAAKKKRDLAKTSLKMLDAQIAANEPQLALPPGAEYPALPPGPEYPALPPGPEYPALPPGPEYPALPPGPTPTPDPTPDPTPTPEPTPTPAEETESKYKRGLLTILDDLTKDLTLTKKDGKRYKASNIKVAKSFKEELKSGNYLYNLVHVVPAILKMPFQLLRKISGKIMYSSNAKKQAETLKQRLDKLSEEDLMTIYNEYRGNRVMQERFPTILNTLIDERIQRFAIEKVTKINGELEVRYKNSFTAIKRIEAIDAALKDPEVSDKQKEDLRNYRKELLRGQAENIAAIRKGYNDANGWYSGGSHGFSEDMKAATTKLSCVGKRFAKDYDLDRKLLHQQALLEEKELQAIAAGDDEAALRAFIAGESLLSQNTEISNSVFGKRSTGKKYYSPLAEQLDYRDDPFIRDLFTTIAVTSSVISAANAIKTHMGQQANLTAMNQKIAANNQKMQDVNRYGSEIAGTRDEMIEGIAAQNVHDTVAVTGEIERGALDINNWNRGTNAYVTADNAGHAFYDNLTTNTQIDLNDIATQYASGAITQQQALDLMIDVSKQTQSTLQSVTSQVHGILQNYRVTHPQFKLDGYESALQYVTQHPDALVDMYKAMADAADKGDILANMQFEQIAPLTSLPSDMQTTIFNAAASTVLASNVATSMNEAARKRKYGNEITSMVEDYTASQASAKEANKSTNK